MKVCPRCSEPKTVDKFSKDSSRRDGLQKWCKDCYREWRTENRDRINAHNREWRAENIDRVRLVDAAYRAEHREERAANTRRWKAENPERVRANRRRARERARSAEQTSQEK